MTALDGGVLKDTESGMTKVKARVADSKAAALEKPRILTASTTSKSSLTSIVLSHSHDDKTRGVVAACRLSHPFGAEQFPEVRALLL